MLKHALVPDSRFPIPDSLRGKLRRNAVLAKRCWFQVGGEADWLFIPEDRDDLCHFMRERPTDLPLYILGVGSNLLVRDGGLRGVAVRLGSAFADIQVIRSSDHPVIRTGAAALDVNVANAARDAGIAGLEFLCGIPGTIGGAVAMNAGAYGREMKDILVSAEAVDDAGDLHVLTPEQLGLTYRHSRLPEGWVVTSALLRGDPGDMAEIEARMQKIKSEREETQPVKSRTGGSTFANPPGDRKAWQLIDEAGCRGMVIGDAQVSEKHCNFLINRGEATATDLEALGEEVRRRVKAQSGMTLEWEIKRIGEDR